MRLLHTSDWHLGRTLCGKKRDDEFESFLNWLNHIIRQQRVDLLIVAGDVFDTGTPSNRTLSLYYSFLRQVSDSCCRHMVLVGGNHDSPSTLNAPKEVLKALDVHVVGCTGEMLDDEVLVLYDQQNRPEAIVCAVPYLRDRDIRTVSVGESISDKEQKLSRGIAEHYQRIAQLACEAQQNHIHHAVPMIATGHLFAAGSKSHADDGMRDLYVGSLGAVSADIFPECFDYVALGHLHTPQMVEGKKHIRYSGAPLAMGFGEAGQTKNVYLVDFEEDKLQSVQEIHVPVFRQLQRIQGDFDGITQQICQLRGSVPICLEIIYTAPQILPNIREQWEAELKQLPDVQAEILRIKHHRSDNHTLRSQQQGETLHDLSPQDVFERCLDAHNIPENQRESLRQSYQEIIFTWQNAHSSM